MAATIKGLGIVWAVNGITMTAGIVSSTAGQAVQSLTYSRTSDKVEIKNDLGEVVGEVYYNGKRELRLTVIPSAVTGTNTIANAVSSLDSHLIAAGTKITIADSSGTVMDGDYNLDSCEMRGDNSSPRMVDIVMHKFDANDVTTTIS